MKFSDQVKEMMHFHLDNFKKRGGEDPSRELDALSYSYGMHRALTWVFSYIVEFESKERSFDVKSDSLPTEVERRFLVDYSKLGEFVKDAKRTRVKQGYFPGKSVIRVRINQDESNNSETAFLTIKSKRINGKCSEFEYSIPPEHAKFMLEHFCRPTILTKSRYEFPFGGKIWEIDVFGEDLYGLVIAEIELSDISDPVELPKFLGYEITDDSRFSNFRLARGVNIRNLLSRYFEMSVRNRRKEIARSRQEKKNGK